MQYTWHLLLPPSYGAIRSKSPAPPHTSQHKRFDVVAGPRALPTAARGSAGAASAVSGSFARQTLHFIAFDLSGMITSIHPLQARRESSTFEQFEADVNLLLNGALPVDRLLNLPSLAGGTLARHRRSRGLGVAQRTWDGTRFPHDVQTLDGGFVCRALTVNRSRK